MCLVRCCGVSRAELEALPFVQCSLAAGLQANWPTGWLACVLTQLARSGLQVDSKLSNWVLYVQTAPPSASGDTGRRAGTGRPARRRASLFRLPGWGSRPAVWWWGTGTAECCGGWLA